MINECAFDPESGAPLTEDKEYPMWFDRAGVRTVQDDGLAYTPSREGALTNGELVSSADGLLGYFRRRARAVRDDDPDGALECAAASTIRQLRRASQGDETDHAIGQSALDIEVWFATAERLAQRGHWAAWMFDQAIPRCPHCRSRVKVREAVGEAGLVCASAPNRHGRVNEAIAERVRTLYRAAFDHWPTEPVFF